MLRCVLLWSSLPHFAEIHTSLFVQSAGEKEVGVFATTNTHNIRNALLFQFLKLWVVEVGTGKIIPKNNNKIIIKELKPKN